MAYVARSWFRASVSPAGIRYVPVLLAVCLISGNASGSQIAGWVEQARLVPAGFDLNAKLDAGAENSSISASEMVFFERKDREHVRFKVQNKKGETVELVQPVVRQTKIKRHGGKTQQRPVLMLTICLGDVRKEAQVNLVDRAGFNYPLLIGRTFLAGEFLIDPASTYRLGPGCGKGAAR